MRSYQSIFIEPLLTWVRYNLAFPISPPLFPSHYLGYTKQEAERKHLTQPVLSPSVHPTPLIPQQLPEMGLEFLVAIFHALGQPAH